MDPFVLWLIVIVAAVIGGSLWKERRDQRRRFEQMRLLEYWDAHGCPCSYPFAGHTRECPFYEPTEEDKLRERARKEVADGWTPTPVNRGDA